MGRTLRVIVMVVTGLLLAGCLSSEPKVAEAEQVAADQRAAMEATESGASEGGGGGGGAAAGGAEFVAADIEYRQAPTELPAGPVSATLVNEGSIEHNVVIEELDNQKILDAPPGETVTAEVEFEPGEYTYFCDVAGHRAAGMEGTLTVTG